MWAAVTIKGHTAFFQPEQPARLLVHTPRPQVVRSPSHLCESRQGFLPALHTALWAVSKVTGVLSCAVNKGRGTGWTLAPPLLASVRAAAHLVGTWVQSRFLEAGCLGGGGGGGRDVCVFGARGTLLSVVRPRSWRSRLSDSHSTPNVFPSGEGYIRMPLTFALYVPN